MLIAEELLLLLTNDRGGLVTGRNETGLGLAGALLCELALMEKVTVDGKGRLRVADPAPTGNAHLDAALGVFADREGKKPKDVLGKVAKGLQDRLHDSLAAAGAVHRERGRVLGVFPQTRWPVVDTAGRRTAVDGLTAVLVGSTAPTARSASLVSLIHAVGAVPKLFGDGTGMSGRALKKRAKTIAEGDWAGAAVSKAISDAQAAITAAVAASAAATAATSGSS
ncbi:GOLPH3/VPS74 family protein [Luteipulveratus flavus]|uniref:GPP34 family phosphoprotein n=1 Tax=Luteipulveratus flavus TaxID=3031728 RepID=A0ABT6CC38_9MICO|nr:GPP34 family phosphoprotein [Luteipulveratus sp. YIM 133296]MDF8266331.1 GPP34 family phosphoprotein [Luteipulveratus sp. YIM 133296]